MEEIVSAVEKKSKSSKKHKKEQRSSSSLEEENSDKKSVSGESEEENESDESVSSESSESESSDNQEAYVFRDSEYGMEAVKTDADPAVYLGRPEVEVIVSKEEFNEIVIEEKNTDGQVVEKLSASSSSSSSSSEDIKDTQYETEQVIESSNGANSAFPNVEKLISSDLEPSRGEFYEQPQPLLHSSIENIEIHEESKTLPDFQVTEEVPYEPDEESSSSSSRSDFKPDIIAELTPIPSITPRESDLQGKKKAFADISSIDIYSTHFVNVNDKSDFSIEISQTPLEFDEEEESKQKIPENYKNETYSGSENETFQELQAFENAFDIEERKSSDSSEKSNKSELDEAVVIENSEIQERESSDSSGIDEVEILKRIQTEPSELNEDNFKDIDIYEKLQDPPVVKLDDYKYEEMNKRVLEEIPEEKERKKSSSSSSKSSPSSSMSSGKGKIEVKEVVEVKETVVVKEKNQEITVEKEVVVRKDIEVSEGNKRIVVEEVKVKETDKNGMKTQEVFKEISVGDKSEKNMIKNSLVDAKRKETDNKKKRDQKSGTACSNCLVF